jgi:hypothetical protein
MQTTEEIPIELECWMLKHGILPAEDMRALYGSKPDVVWPEEKEDLTKVSMGWKPSYDGEEPPF